MMDLYKMSVKYFLEDEKSLPLDTLIPIFHEWIKNNKLDTLLVDVADYAHVPNGPGVVLIGYDGDFYLDSMEGEAGVLYTRKQPLHGSLSDRIKKIIQLTKAVCSRLEQEETLKGSCKFNAGRFMFLINDRLNAPNTADTFEAVKEALNTAVQTVYPDKKAALKYSEEDKRRRFAVEIKLN